VKWYQAVTIAEEVQTLSEHIKIIRYAYTAYLAAGSVVWVR